MQIKQDKMINDSSSSDGRQDANIERTKLKYNRYKKICKLGQGAYGSVCKCYDQQLNRTIALKKIKFSSEDEGMPVNALREITLLKRLRHQNIVEINEVHYSWERPQICINLEFVPQTLYEHYKRYFPLSPYAVKNYLFQLAQATYFMHSHLIMHRDLKPDNIMVTEDGKIKVCDFGQASTFSISGKQLFTTSISTLWYRAPEVLLGSEEYTSAVDVWSIGVVFAEIIMGKPIFISESQIGQIFAIMKVCGTPSFVEQNGLGNCRHMSPQFPKFRRKDIELDGLSVEGNDLLQKMLKIDPLKRISIGKILKHDYFQGLW